jgi:iron complex transport system ATP-binding protein
MSIVLATRDLSVQRGQRPVVRELSLHLAAGEAVALVGPNAAGKSTLLRALSGLIPAATGEIRIQDRPLTEWQPSALARSLALVIADEDAASFFTVHEAVAFGRYPHLGPFRPQGVQDRLAIAQALDQTGLTALAHRRVSTLSAGERQLVALARGLAQEPNILLLDEPIAHLDIGHELALFRTLDEVRRHGVAILAVIHDLARASAWAERMIVLAHGRIIADGAPQRVLADAAVAEAFGVAISGHRIEGLKTPLYAFQEREGQM